MMKMNLAFYKILQSLNLPTDEIDSFMDEYTARMKEIEWFFSQRKERAERIKEEDESVTEADHARLLREGRVSLYDRTYQGILGAASFECQLETKIVYGASQKNRVDLMMDILQRAVSKKGEGKKAWNLPRWGLEVDDEYHLIVFDLDGTLVDAAERETFQRGVHDFNVWRGLDKFFETEKENNEFEEEYIHGKITYEQWVDKILTLYVERGANRENLYEAIEPLQPMEGAMETLLELRRRNKRLAIVSGSLGIVLDRFFPRDFFKRVEINEVYFDKDGKITGWKATPYGDGKGKMLGLIEVCGESIHSLETCVYVGDGYNDLYAVRLAGMGIAFFPSGGLQYHCDVLVGGTEECSGRQPSSQKRDLREILRYL